MAHNRGVIPNLKTQAILNSPWCKYFYLRRLKMIVTFPCCRMMACLLILVISGSGFAASGDEPDHVSRLSGEQYQVYRDPRGYFEVILPPRWRVTDEYSGDPRGKVLFSGPDGLKWRIISGAGGTSSLNDLRTNARAARDLVPSLRIREDKLNQWDAVIIEGDIQGEYNRMFSFMASEEAHSFSFFGKQAALNRNWSVLETAMQTFVPLVRNSSEEDRKQATLAHLIRLTTLLYDMGDMDSAKASLRTAVELDAHDERVITLTDKLFGPDVHTNKPATVHDANTVGAANDDTGSPQADPQFPFDIIPAEYFLSGNFKYLLAFFLLWTPLIGVAGATGIGLLGKHAIQYTSNFAPLALFWLVVTAAGCFSVISAPLAAIWEVWLVYADNGLIAPYVFNFFGAVTLGAVIWRTIRFYMSRVKNPHRIKTDSNRAVSFARNYTIMSDGAKKNSILSTVLSSENCPWKNTVSPESIAVAKADKGHLFLSESELLLSIRQDDQYFFEVLTTKRVTLDDVRYALSVPENTLTLTIVLRTGYLKKLTVECVCEVSGEQFAPAPCDHFVSQVLGDSAATSKILARVDDLQWFEPDAKRGFFSSFSNDNLMPAMEYALLQKALPRTLSKPVTTQHPVSPQDPPTFVECAPILLLYEIGMAVDALNNWQEAGLLKQEDAMTKSDYIYSCAVLGYFCLKVWGLGRYSADLSELCMWAGKWREAPSDNACLRRITSAWQRFAHEVRTNSSEYAKDIAGKVYIAEQITAVENRMHSAEPTAVTDEKPRAVNTGACPKCKFAFKWNGKSCSHCGYAKAR
ncbi:MAG: hypothetical protein IH624_06425 [Phycisphaerae bacterium]|nr:hypothetical protein [Phycisphaerae bacterium]